MDSLFAITMLLTGASAYVGLYLYAAVRDAYNAAHINRVYDEGFAAYANGTSTPYAAGTTDYYLWGNGYRTAQYNAYAAMHAAGEQQASVNP